MGEKSIGALGVSVIALAFAGFSVYGPWSMAPATRTILLDVKTANTRRR